MAHVSHEEVLNPLEQSPCCRDMKCNVLRRKYRIYSERNGCISEMPLTSALHLIMHVIEISVPP
jgi:hypothetical protein